MPFFLDQFSHCKTLTQYLNMGKLLEPFAITEQSFRETLLDVLENKTFAQNALGVKDLMWDKPIKLKDLFLYWINYAIRHKGAQNLVSKAPFRLNAMQYWSLDVVCFIFTSSLGIVCLFIVTCVTLHRKCCTKSSKEKIQ